MPEMDKQIEIKDDPDMRTAYNEHVRHRRVEFAQARLQKQQPADLKPGNRGTLMNGEHTQGSWPPDIELISIHNDEAQVKFFDDLTHTIPTIVVPAAYLRSDEQLREALQQANIAYPDLEQAGANINPETNNYESF